MIIATKHKKEIVISPVLKASLGVTCRVHPALDTDTLGTFTGEVERSDDALSTARKKCFMAMEIGKCDMAVASEGSFGPHPTFGFIPADDELLMFVDARNDLEIVVRELSLKTNFNGQEIRTEAELNAFADQARFPGHGLIMRKSSSDSSEMIKGITDPAQLKASFLDFISRYGVAYVETDMRAMYNPTRMEVIKTAARKLADRIVSFCPQCSSPGFGVVKPKPGLPCLHCGFPTRSTLYHEYQCMKCDYQEDKKYPHGKMFEQPTFCDRCNP